MQKISSESRAACQSLLKVWPTSKTPRSNIFSFFEKNLDVRGFLAGGEGGGREREREGGKAQNFFELS